MCKTFIYMPAQMLFCDMISYCIALILLYNYAKMSECCYSFINKILSIIYEKYKFVIVINVTYSHLCMSIRLRKYNWCSISICNYISGTGSCYV